MTCLALVFFLTKVYYRKLRASPVLSAGRNSDVLDTLLESLGKTWELLYLGVSGFIQSGFVLDSASGATLLKAVIGKQRVH